MPRKLTKREALARAHRTLHNASFDLIRMGFDLVNLLVFTGGGNKDVVVSDLTLHQLRISARRALGSIDTTIDLLRPYAAKKLADPDEAFASLEKREAQ